MTVEPRKIVAVGLLTQRDVDVLGNGFSRLWPVDDASCFTDLLQAIDDADRELGEENQPNRGQSESPALGRNQHSQ